MKSILITPPAIEPVTLVEAKAHLRIDNDAEDELIGKLIVAARHHIEAAAGLALITQGWSHFLDRWPKSNAVELPLAPVMAIDEVKVYGEDDEAAVIDPSHYFADRITRPARLVLRHDRMWPPPGRMANGIEISVTLGYGEAASDVPQALRSAIVRLLTHWYENRGDDKEPAGPPLGIDLLVQPFRELRL